MKYLIILFLVYISCDIPHTDTASKSDQNAVITQHGILEELLQTLTQDTDISVYNPGDTTTSLATLSSVLTEKEAWLDSIAPVADAAVGFHDIIPQDNLYPVLRRKNIRIVEIEGSRSYYPGAPTPGLLRNTEGDINPYFWLSLRNCIYMAHNIGTDLTRLFPAEAETIADNRENLKNSLQSLETEYGNKFARLPRFDAAVMDSDFDYLLQDINLFVTQRFPHEIHWDREDSLEFQEAVEEGHFSVLIHRWNPGGEIEQLCTENDIPIITLPTGIPANDHFDEGLVAFYRSLLEKIHRAFK
ncbi:MAG: metal ABC transporter solute-binding protein, Zn/Mn family [Fibrobacterota bacterium]